MGLGWRKEGSRWWKGRGSGEGKWWYRGRGKRQEWDVWGFVMEGEDSGEVDEPMLCWVGGGEGVGGGALHVFSSLGNQRNCCSDQFRRPPVPIFIFNYYRGLCPPTKNNNSDHTHSSSHRSSGVITDGSLVRLRNGPPCGPNSIVFNESGLRPRVGKTMNIIEHSGLDPKTSILVKVFKDSRPHSSKINGVSVSTSSGMSSHESTLSKNVYSELQFEGLEVWSLSNVVFLDDSPAVLGRVVTVDQLQAIVDISHASSESGTMGSTSTAPSTLKVFKVSEIEPCMDSRLTFKPSRDPSAMNVSSQSDAGGGNDRSAPTQEGGEGGAGNKGNDEGDIVSQHIAGLVQHTPLCLLTPTLLNSLSSKSHYASTMLPEMDSGHTRSVCVYGHLPLAMKMTDNGPMMLVKRISDGSAFLTCSGHSGFISFSSSSFVSLSSRESKFGRCTIAEESVSAVDGGYERVKHPHAASYGGVLSHLSILMLHKSQAMMLQDANGHISSLSEGLRLKSSLPGQRHNKSQPLMPYKCVVTRTYLVKKDTTVTVVVVGKFQGNNMTLLTAYILQPSVMLVQCVFP